jgi:TPR repeat protein
MLDLNLILARSKGLSLVAAAALSACAAPSSYMGISLKPNSAPIEVQHLAERAMAGDKRAQLDLGIAFEEGRSVERNLTQAKKLYRLASTDGDGESWLYIPKVGNAPARVVRVGQGPKQLGLSEAKVRLQSMNDAQQ